MGYRSDLIITHAFTSEEQMKEVLASFCVDKRFAEYDIVNVMHVGKECTSDNKWTFFVMFKIESWKWYEDSIIDLAYADVACVNHFLTLCKQFNEQRGFPFGYKFFRVGEDYEDIEEREDSSKCQEGERLEDFLASNVFVSRAIDHTLHNLKTLKEYSRETLSQESTV